MATSSVAAAVDLYNSLSAAAFGGTRPPLAFDQMPATNGAGAQQRLPYVVLKDGGLAPEFESAGGVERGTLTVEVYAETLAAVDVIVLAVKYGGAAPASKAGFDWGTLTLTGHLRPVSLRRTREQRRRAGFNFNGQQAHMAELAYECITQLNPS